MSDTRDELSPQVVDSSATKRKPRPRPPVTGIPMGGEYQGRLIVPDDFDEPLEQLRELME